MLTLMTALSYYDHPGYRDGGPGWWIIVPLLWLALFATAVVFFARNRRRVCHPAARGETTLANRFAAGEIDADEYHERLAVLKASRK